MTGIDFLTMAGIAVFLQALGILMQRLYPGASLGRLAFKSAFPLRRLPCRSGRALSVHQGFDDAEKKKGLLIINS